MTEGALAGRTIVMSGGSRGIGLAIALRAAREGANIALVAKTDRPDPRIPGTVHSAADQIDAAGGRALAIVGDIRNDEDVERAVTRAVEEFGGIDIVVNNASAISLDGFGELSAKRYDLMFDINVRGTFALTSTALPHLLESTSPRVLTLSPPINLDPRWLGAHAPYTASKYAMTLLTCGVAEQFRAQGLVANCLWPETLIATAAVLNIVGDQTSVGVSRRPEIMAEAAAILLSRPAEAGSGQCYIDADVLRAAGRTDLGRYAAVEGVPDAELQRDLFL